MTRRHERDGKAARETPNGFQDGFIVVAVLWILGALATLASIYAVYVVNTAAALSVNDDRLQSEAVVTGALELAAYQITATPEGRPPAGRFGFRIGRANVSVDFRAENGRIDLNAAPKELLIGLFASLGVRGPAAEAYADRIVGWRTPAPEGQDPEAAAYQTAGIKYPPRGGPFPHVGELSLVMGLPPSLVDRLQPLVTVYSGMPQVNVLAATPAVLAALPGMTPQGLHAVLAQQRRIPPDGPATLALMGAAQTLATTETTAASRVSVTVDLDNGRRMKFEVVILIFTDGAEPYRVLSWRDELDEPPTTERTRTGSR